MADDDVLSPLTIKDQKRPTQLLKLLMALGAIPLFVQMQERALSKDNVEKFLLSSSSYKKALYNFFWPPGCL
jgi:hypothetical protein